jgi:hypothetical protein
MTETVNWTVNSRLCRSRLLTLLCVVCCALCVVVVVQPVGGCRVVTPTESQHRAELQKGGIELYPVDASAADFTLDDDSYACVITD